MSVNQYDPWLSDDDVQKIVAAVKTRSPDATHAEIYRVLDWAIYTRIRFALLSSVLEGELNCAWDYNADQPSFIGANFARGARIQ